MRNVALLVDSVSLWFGRCAAWAYFIIALTLGYEVFMRYLFIAPTIWAEEVSRLLLVWATFGGAALLLHRRQHITITVITDSFSARVRQIQEVAVLLFIGCLAVVIVWYASGIALDSFERGRTTGSMLDLPAWWVEVALPVCFTLLGLQAFLEAARVAVQGPVEKASPSPSH